MTANQNIKQEIKDKIEHIPANRLIDILEYVRMIEQQETYIQKILSCAGMRTY